MICQCHRKSWFVIKEYPIIVSLLPATLQDDDAQIHFTAQFLYSVEGLIK